MQKLGKPNLMGQFGYFLAQPVLLRCIFCVLIVCILSIFELGV